MKQHEGPGTGGKDARWTATLGAGQPPEAPWSVLARHYLENPLPRDERVALLCAALERPGHRASPLHATGLSLMGHEQRPVALESVWRGLAEDPDGAGLLRATAWIGQGRDAEPDDLAAAHRTLGPWTPAWSDVVAFAAWCEARRRCLGPRLHPSGHPGLDDWLAQLVRARGVLDGVLDRGTVG